MLAAGTLSLGREQPERKAFNQTKEAYLGTAATAIEEFANRQERLAGGNRYQRKQLFLLGLGILAETMRVFD